MKLIAPNNRDIVGTLDKIPGVAQISFVNGGTPEEGFDVEVEGTEVNWDGQRTETACGQRIFVDDDGNTWLERELRLVDDDWNPRKKRKGGSK